MLLLLHEFVNGGELLSLQYGDDPINSLSREDTAGSSIGDEQANSSYIYGALTIHIFEIISHASSIIPHLSQTGQDSGSILVSLVRGSLEPPKSLADILRNTCSIKIAYAEATLRTNIASLSCFS
jgi:hypothetical protein